MPLNGLGGIDLLSIGNEIQLVGAVYHGLDRLFLFLLPEMENEEMTDLDVRVLGHEDWKRFLRQSDLLEVQALTEDEDGVVKKAIIRKTARTVSQDVSWRVFRRDGFRCRYCGADDVALTVDHLVLWEEGGPSIEENLVTACKRCNRTRGNMQLADWLSSHKYQKRSRRLTTDGKRLNLGLLPTLDAIPRQPIKKKR